MRTDMSGAPGGYRVGRGLAGGISLVLAGAVGLGAAVPAQAAVEYVNPFDINQGFTIVGTGDVALNNGEIEGSAAAFGTISTTSQTSYPIIHNAAGMADYEVPVIDGDPVRVLANQYVGSGDFQLTNRDDSGTAGEAELTAIAKFGDVSNLTAAQQADFTRLTNTDGGLFDVAALPYDASTWQESVTSQQPVADYFGDVDAQVTQTNQCLAAMYEDPALANELTVTRNGVTDITLSGFSTTEPNWLTYEDIVAIDPNVQPSITIDPPGWVPTADAPLIIKVNDPTDMMPPVQVNGWSYTPGAQQDFARYMMFDLSTVTSDPIRMDGVEAGAVWAPGVNLEISNSRTTNGQYFAQDVTSGAFGPATTGELHHHTFLGQIPCETETPTASFQMHKVVAGDAAGLVPEDTEFTVGWEVTAGPDEGQAGTLTVLADGTVVDGPELLPDDEVTFTEGPMPQLDGVVWGDPAIAPNPLTLDDSGTVVDVEVTNTANSVPTGGFGVLKSVDGTGADLVDLSTEFIVEWEVTEGPDTGRSGSLTVPADGTVVDGPQDLVDGDVVTFSEPEAPEVDGTTFEGVSIDPESVTIDTSVSESPVVTVTNTYDLASASFQMHKVVTGDAAGLVPEDTEFTVGWEVTAGPDEGQTGTLTVLADGTVVDGPELVPGDQITFTEGTLPEVDGVVWGDPVIDPNPLTLDASGALVDVEVTNTANSVPTGGFGVLKSVDGTGADLVDPSTEFTVEWEVTDGPDMGRTGTLMVSADGTLVEGPQDLVDGDVVTFSEPEAPQVDGTTFEGVSIDPESVTIDTSASEPPIVTVTNTYDLAPASFQMHKAIAGDAAGLVPEDTEFAIGWEVIEGPDVGQVGTLTLLADGTVVDGPELSHGDVVEFSEPELPEVDGVVWGDPVIDPNPLTLDASGALVDVEVTNTANSVPTGGFGVLKSVDGTGASLVPADMEFTVEWEVTDGPDTGRSGSLTVSADGALVEGPQDLVDGDVVTFSEPEAPQVDGTTFEGVSIDPESVTIDTSASEPPIVTVTNTYDLAPASFQMHKAIAGDAAGLVPEDTEFTVGWEVTSGPDTGATGTLDLPADGTPVTGPDLTHGDVVTFTETTPPQVDGVEWGEVTLDPESITLDATADPADVTVTNTAHPGTNPPGPLPQTGPRAIGTLALLAGLLTVGGVMLYRIGTRREGWSGARQ